MTQARWIVAFWHYPPYSKGSHDSDTEGPLVAMLASDAARLPAMAEAKRRFFAARGEVLAGRINELDGAALALRHVDDEDALRLR